MRTAQGSVPEMGLDVVIASVSEAISYRSMQGCVCKGIASSRTPRNDVGRKGPGVRGMGVRPGFEPKAWGSGLALCLGVKTGGYITHTRTH